MTNYSYKDIEETLYKFQLEYDVEIVIASLGGSTSIGTNNGASDCDVYCIYIPKKSILANPLLYKNSATGTEIHIINDTLLNVINNADKYIEKKKVYLTFYSRSNKQAEYERNLNMYQREDYSRSLLYYTMLGNTRWFFSYTYDACFKLFQKYINKFDIIDFYFTKAAGNYYNNIIKKQHVNCRKYLIVLQELLYCMEIIYNKKIPPMKITDLISLNKFDIEISKKIVLYYELNAHSNEDKDKIEIDYDESFNIFIGSLLEKVKSNFKEIDKQYYEIEDLR